MAGVGGGVGDGGEGQGEEEEEEEEEEGVVGGASKAVSTKRMAVSVADMAKAELSKGADRRAGLRVADSGGDGEPAALKFAQHLMRNESARMDARLLVDYKTILDGHCKYVPHLLGGAQDFSRIQALASDLDQAASVQSGGMIQWSKHLKHENPDWSGAFAAVVQAMADYFGGYGRWWHRCGRN